MSDPPGPRIFVTGVGSFSPCGRGTAAVWERLASGEPAVQAMPHPVGRGRHRLCGKIAEAQIEAALPASKLRRLSRYSRLVVAAAAACLDDCGLGQRGWEGDPARVGLFSGSSRGPLEAAEILSLELLQAGAGRVSPLYFQETVYNAPLGHISIHFRMSGPAIALASGVASGMQALEMARSYLQAGDLDLALVGGVDSLTGLYLQGLSDVRALSPRSGGCEAIAPFAADRNGIVASEGAVFIALETGASCARRGAKPLVEVDSVASASDGYSPYGNDPTGKGFRLAMARCLEQASMGLDDVELLVAAASGQPELDAAERRAIEQLWSGTHWRVPVVAWKGVLGDMGAATSLLCVALCGEVFRRCEIPPIRPFREADPECRLDLVRHPLRRAISTALVNEGGWGGIHATALLRKVEAG